MQMITEDATNDVETQGYSVPESNKSKVKTECWNEKTNSVVPECMYEDGSIKPECYKEQVSEVQPVAIKEFQSRQMTVEEFVEKYRRTVRADAQFNMDTDGLDEEEATIKAIKELAGELGITLLDLQSVELNDIKF